jgi:hypothetical protein
MNVIISPNIKKERVRIDTLGNVIDPHTKEIIERNEVYKPTKEQIQAITERLAGTDATQTEEPSTDNAPKGLVQTLVDLSSPKAIQEQIYRVEEELNRLKELKRIKIEDMKRELQELEGE